MRLGVVMCACVLAVLGIRVSPIPEQRATIVRQLSPATTFSVIPNQQLVDSLSSWPWAFELNIGQTDMKVKFMARANDAAVRKFEGKPNGAVKSEFLGRGDGTRVSGRSMLRGKTNY